MGDILSACLSLGSLESKACIRYGTSESIWEDWGGKQVEEKYSQCEEVWRSPELTWLFCKSLERHPRTALGTQAASCQLYPPVSQGWWSCYLPYSSQNLGARDTGHRPAVRHVLLVPLKAGESWAELCPGWRLG
jgi:hypothetical protein